MASTLLETPRANRVNIAFFGLRNAGKSTLVNQLTGSEIAIVSPTPGTTTDPVSKAMEILPLGPCLITDTAGLDDEGALGEKRVERTLKVLETTDIAVWVGEGFEAWKRYFKVPTLEFRRGDSVEELKKKLAAVRLADEDPPLLEGLVQPGDRVTLVCPIDESAPKGRLILPQVQVLRECLDLHLTCRVVQPEEFTDDGSLTIVDSQVFGRIKAKKITSFSILFARQKGDIGVLKRGLDAIRSLQDGDRVLIAEGCTHHRQCNDIGAVKIPKALAKLTGGRKLHLEFVSGSSFLSSPSSDASLPPPSLIVQCGGCMLTRREVLRRIALAETLKIPIVNYGLLLASAAGVEIEKCVI